MTTTALTHSMTEDQLLTAITEAATLYGWRWFHIRRSDKALQQGDPGFPDLVLARKGHVLFLELKAGRGKLTDDQIAWIEEINTHIDGDHIDVREARVVWPTELDYILRLLR